jgi:hypothetical protein
MPEFGRRRRGHCSAKKGKSEKSVSSWGLSEGEADGEQEGACSLPPRSERMGMWRGGLPLGARHSSTGKKALVRLELKPREGGMGEWGLARGAWGSCGGGRRPQRVNGGVGSRPGSAVARDRGDVQGGPV